MLATQSEFDQKADRASRRTDGLLKDRAEFDKSLDSKVKKSSCARKKMWFCSRRCKSRQQTPSDLKMEKMETRADKLHVIDESFLCDFREYDILDTPADSPEYAQGNATSANAKPCDMDLADQNLFPALAPAEGTLRKCQVHVKLMSGRTFKVAGHSVADAKKELNHIQSIPPNREYAFLLDGDAVPSCMVLKDDLQFTAIVREKPFSARSSGMYNLVPGTSSLNQAPEGSGRVEIQNEQFEDWIKDSWLCNCITDSVEAAIEIALSFEGCIAFGRKREDDEGPDPAGQTSFWKMKGEHNPSKRSDAFEWYDMWGDSDGAHQD